MTGRPEWEEVAGADATPESEVAPGTDAAAGTERDPALETRRGTETRAEAPEDQSLSLRMATRLDRVEVRLERLLAEVAVSGEQVQALTRHLTAPRTETEFERRLAEMVTGLEDVHQQLDELAGSITRLNRVQFKANTLLDAKAQETERALAVLQEIATRRDEVRATWDADEGRRLSELRAEGRAEMVADLLPVLDGIERALESGTALLEQRRTASSGQDEEGGAWQKLRWLLGGESPAPKPAEAGMADALAAWLDGLLLGRERFQELLAAEGVEPIEALGRAFDPRLHEAMAIEARDDVAPGTVIRVLRPGYRRGERPVRFAEVVVSRGSPAAEADGRGVDTRDGEISPTAEPRSEGDE